MEERFVDYHFNYKGFGVYDSFCEVEVWEHKGKYLVILTEPDLSGTSVTNACEGIATKLYQTKNVFPKGTYHGNIAWIEHYPERRGFPETFDRIHLEYDGRKNEYVNPTWKHIGEKLSEEKKLEILSELPY